MTVKRAYRYFRAGLFSILAGWIGYALVGSWAARCVAARFGGLLSRIAKGKINDPGIFVQCCIRDLLWLMTLTLVWAGAHMAINLVIRGRSWSSLRACLVQGVAGFVLLNVWIAFAADTPLFWTVMGVGSGIENYMQFQLKRLIADEIQSPEIAVLVGSSQTCAQIDEGLLNQRLGRDLWTTQLHFPGSKAYDLLIIEPQLDHVRARLVICYFSEGYLYCGSHGETVPHFLRFSQLSDAWRRGAMSYLAKREVICGLIGDALPLFRCRGILTQRLLGSAIASLQQIRHDASLPRDLNARALQSAKEFHVDDESDFQKRAFEDFLDDCAKAHRRVILLTGGYNPVLTDVMNVAVRADMLRFLDQVQKRHPNVTVIPASKLPEQRPSDYEDLTHINPDMQKRFSEWLATLLEKDIRAKVPDLAH